MSYNNSDLDDYHIPVGIISLGKYSLSLSNSSTRTWSHGGYISNHPHGKYELAHLPSGLYFKFEFSEDTNIKIISTTIKNDEIQTKEWAKNNGASFGKYRFGTKITFSEPTQRIKEDIFIIHDIQRERTNIADKDSDEALEFIRENIDVNIATRSENRRIVVSAISFFSPKNNHDMNINKIIEDYIQPRMPAP